MRFVGWVFVLFFVTFSFAHAQFSMLSGAGVKLSANPPFPAPHSTVVVSLDDYSVDMVGATVSWLVDGERQPDMENNRSISLKTGGVGKKLSVRAVLSKTGTPALSAEISLVPSTVDIIIESNSYVPPFYKGKSLPTANAPVRLVAVVDDGTGASQSSYTYTWKRNGDVLFGGPLMGKNSVNLATSLFGDDRVSVSVSLNDVPVGEAEAVVTVSEPEIHFYEYSPLRGLMLREVRDPFSFVSNETTIYGEPYFLGAPLTANAVAFTWKLNGTEVQSKAGAPNALVLERTGETGSAQVEYQVVTKGAVPQLVKKALNLIFE